VPDRVAAHLPEQGETLVHRPGADALIEQARAERLDMRSPDLPDLPALEVRHQVPVEVSRVVLERSLPRGALGVLQEGLRQGVEVD